MEVDRSQVGIIKTTWNYLTGNQNAKLIGKHDIDVLKDKLDIRKESLKKAEKMAAVVYEDQARRAAKARLEELSKEDRLRKIAHDQRVADDYYRNRQSIADSDVPEEQKDFLQRRLDKHTQDHLDEIDAIRERAKLVED